MKKDSTVNNLKKLFQETGFDIVSLEGMHTSFDIIAKRKGTRFIIKVVYNIDSVDKKTVKDLKSLSAFFNADPLIIGTHSNNGLLEPNLVYERFNMQCLSEASFHSLITGVMPDLASKSIGRKVEVDGSRLRYLRKLNNITIDKLASTLHLSKDTIYRHERFNGYASEETVKKLESVLGSQIKPNYSYIFQTREEVEYKNLGKIKMQTISLSSAPFNIAAKKKNYYEISQVNLNQRTLLKRASILRKMSESFENNKPFFLGKSAKKQISGIAVIDASKLQKMESEEELIDLLEKLSNP